MPVDGRSCGRSRGAAAALFALIAAFAAPARATDKVEALLQAMTLDEKIGMLIGNPIAGPPDPLGLAGAGFTPGVPRLGVPPLRYADGPAGVRTALPATALPSPVALAATFSTRLAHGYGQVIGHEAQAGGQDVLFGPMVNLVRVPTAGRNFETLGEDPLLQSRLVASEIAGVQGEGTIATIKHFAENNQENNRMQVDVLVDDQTLRELELPAFEAAIGAGAGAVMCAYNKVNGTFSCENPALLRGILRREWGFTGFVVSDYGANHSTKASLEAGLDVEFLSTIFAGLPVRGGSPETAIAYLVANGLLDVSVVDGAVRHVLTSMDRFGLLEGASPDGAPVADHPRPEADPSLGAGLAREVAVASAVLLRNERRTLPLRPDDLRPLAVIGPTARIPLLGGGGSARVQPFPGAAVSALEALRARAGEQARIGFEPGIELDGVAIPPAALSPTNPASEPGLLRTASPGGEAQVDPKLDFTGPDSLPAAAGTTWTWTGWLTASTTGDYELRLQAEGGATVDGFDTRLLVGGSIVASTGGLFPVNGSLIPTLDGLANAGAVVALQAGVPRQVTVVANGSPTGPSQLRLAWITPEQRAARLAAAVGAARSARSVVVFAYNEGTEGADRPSLALPRGQDGLIQAVVAANRNTVVVLNTGDPVTMPWVDDVGAILETWYPGQGGGEATADLLLGEANPGGKLPVTFPVRLEDNPTFTPDGRRYPGIPPTGPGARELYEEGIFVGYRWYDAQGITPLFPFGHGLSYTRFKYSELHVRRDRRGLEVSFLVRNVGRERGADVPQLYLGPARTPPAGVQMAEKALAGFERVELRPGEARRVTLRVSSRALSFWSEAEGGWVVAQGKRAVLVGASSRDIRLKGEVRVGR